MGLSENRKRGRPFQDELTVLEKIAEWFLAPIVAYCPRGMSKFVFLEQMFGVDERWIGRFRTKKNLRISGLYVAIPTHTIKGYGDRKVKKGTELFVRLDIKEPTVIDVSGIFGAEGREQWFRLTPEEWSKLKRYLEPIDDDAHYLGHRD